MEPITQTSIITIEDPSQVALARRSATEFAHLAKLSEQRVAAVSVVAVELANNLLQHAIGGSLYLQYTEATGTLDLASVDHGKGMQNVQRCLEDGFSTASTPGLGLGAIRRFAMDFAAYSIPARTTVVAARMAQEKITPSLGIVSTAIAGETLSGDSWAVSDDGFSFLVVDGLGHGLLASDAARAAVAMFRKRQTDTPQQILEAMHLALRSTRGAAAAVVKVDPDRRVIDFAGIGNIGCTVLNRERNQSMVSHNGTLGHQMRRVQQFQYFYAPLDLLLMQSDGLMTHSKIGYPPALFVQPPFLVAPFLYSEQVRGRDDATLLVNRLG
jgi:anti-sigma regulatory factor (Ser/Thr protein kinase)